MTTPQTADIQAPLDPQALLEAIQARVAEITTEQLEAYPPEVRALVEDIGMLTSDVIEEELQLPEVPPELYADRQVVQLESGNFGKEDAITFLRRVWGEYLDARVLYQDQLQKLDEKLLQGIKNQCKIKKMKTADIVPPKRARTDKMLSELGDNGTDIKRLVWAKDQRSREKRKNS